jgi:hypothetical protein
MRVLYRTRRVIEIMWIGAALTLIIVLMLKASATNGVGPLRISSNADVMLGNALVGLVPTMLIMSLVLLIMPRQERG